MNVRVRETPVRGKGIRERKKGAKDGLIIDQLIFII